MRSYCYYTTGFGFVNYFVSQKMSPHCPPPWQKVVSHREHCKWLCPLMTMMEKLSPSHSGQIARSASVFCPLPSRASTVMGRVFILAEEVFSHAIAEVHVFCVSIPIQSKNGESLLKVSNCRSLVFGVNLSNHTICVVEKAKEGELFHTLTAVSPSTQPNLPEG